jgi:hypothetical protein
VRPRCGRTCTQAPEFYGGIPGHVKAIYAHQTRRRWGHTAMRGWAELVIDRHYLAGGGHSAWSAPLRALDEDPDEAGALLDFHFTNPSAGSGRVLKLHAMSLLVYLLCCLDRAPAGGAGKKYICRHTGGKRAPQAVFLGPFLCVFPSVVLKPTRYSRKPPEASRHNAPVHEIHGSLTSRARTEKNSALFSKGAS